ncbi:ComEC/Rec2 family competence protein [Gardnerella vaginalis]|uniref:ComEC/Rec2 family competence protein n=1 Tax=Gardnerella vaginalis TaxID=2702 RepID=UPI00031B631B|nr:ComEC/Rec2 family competence protein [Gardnerella vaginalis]
MKELYWDLENGNKDFRLVPIAFSVWFGCLFARFIVDSQQDFFYMIIAIISFTLLCFYTIFSVGNCIFTCCLKNTTDYKSRIKLKFYELIKKLKIIGYKHAFLTSLCAFLAAFIMCSIILNIEHMDPVFNTIKDLKQSDTEYKFNRKNEVKSIRLLMDITSPPRVSQSFKGDCVLNVNVKQIEIMDKEKVISRSKSFVSAKLYAFNPDCKIMNYGYKISSFGKISISKFDSHAIEIQVPKANKTDKTKLYKVEVIEKANLFKTLLNVLWKEFYNVTSSLDEQGQMLVPGFTVGLLGQEHLSDVEDLRKVSIDSTYANTMKQRFKIAGIMHLMAVSGGHFLLLSCVIRKTCAFLLLPRVVSAIFEACGHILLSCIVYPSASVLRALIMGLISAGALMFSRQYQSASALSLTVISVLFICPKYAWDYSFALSVCATFGIIIMGIPLKKIFLRYMSSSLASALSITLCAQCFTLPVQILMQPQVSFISVIANLIVAPFVDFATIFGLLSLVCAHWSYSISLIFATISSFGTNIMANCAWYLGDLQIGTIPWVNGSLGAWLIACAEFAIFLLALLINKYFRKSESYNSLRILLQVKLNRFKQLINDSTKLFE